jgi:hypothetical protein
MEKIARFVLKIDLKIADEDSCEYYKYIGWPGFVNTQGCFVFFI